MSSKIITLMISRDLAERLLTEACNGNWSELNKLLSAPVVERQPVEPEAWRCEDYMVDKSSTTHDPKTAARWIAKGWAVEPLYTDPPELAGLQAKEPDPTSWPSLKSAYDESQATIAQQAAEIERLKSESFESLYNAAIDERDALIERLKGGQGELVSFPRELDDELAELIATQARVCGGGAYDIWEAICEQFGTSQPAPVSVVLPEWLKDDSPSESILLPGSHYGICRQHPRS